MKILIISDAWYPQLNGVVRTYEYLTKYLQADGHEIKVIGPSDFPFKMSMPGYAEIKLTLFARRRMKKMLADFAPDYLHIATEGPLGWTTWKIARSMGLKFTTCYHTHFPDYVAARVRKLCPPLAGFFRTFAISSVKKFHDASSAVMVATKSLEAGLKNWNFTAPMAPLTRGVDMDIFKPGSKTLFKDLKGPIALYVGRIAIEKSIEDFLDMQWHGSKVVVGHGPDLDHLKKKYPDALFTGKVTSAALGDHYRSADVFVFPSRTDTFGMVLIEALACGLPVAAYNVTGPKDIITNKTLGIFDENLSSAAYEAMKHGNAATRSQHIKDHYTWEKAAEQFMEASRG
jgi:glycosyltransferase involved in cell wall biosynthesis